MTNQKIGDFFVLNQLSSSQSLVKHPTEEKFFRLTFFDKNEDASVIAEVEKQIDAFTLFSNIHFLSVHKGSYFEERYYLLEEAFIDSKNLIEVDELLEVQVISLTKCLFDLFDHLPHGLFHGHLSITSIYMKDDLFCVGGFGRGILQKTIHSNAAFWQAFASFDSLNLAINEKKMNFEQSQLLYENFCLSSEQILDSVADKRSDVFAIGVILYFALTKKFPFAGYSKIKDLRSDLEKNWDSLLAPLLQSDPNQRPLSLMPLLEEMLKKSVKKPLNAYASTLEGTFLRALQMAEDRKKQAPNPFAPEYKPKVIREMTPSPKIVDPVQFMQTEMAVTQYIPKGSQVLDVEPIKTKTIVIPQGSYFRGSKHGPRDEMPRHLVKINSFSFEIHPVTNEQFVRYLQHIGGVKDETMDVIRLKDSRIKLLRGRFHVETGYGQHPVTGVTWYGANGYAKWMGGRLPTEAEWEIAACGTDTDRLYPTGKTISKNQANFFSSDTTKVMSYPPNAIGLYDMAGNVYEWCQDWYEFHYYDISKNEPINPTGPVQGVYRCLRGGCWKSLPDDLRCAHRHRNNPGSFNATYGFRCAFDIT